MEQGVPSGVHACLCEVTVARLLHSVLSTWMEVMVGTAFTYHEPASREVVVAGATHALVQVKRVKHSFLGSALKCGVPRVPPSSPSHLTLCLAPVTTYRELQASLQE